METATLEIMAGEDEDDGMRQWLGFQIFDVMVAAFMSTMGIDQFVGVETIYVSRCWKIELDKTSKLN